MARITRSEVHLGQLIADEYNRDCKRQQIRERWAQRNKRESRQDRLTIIAVCVIVLVMYGMIYAKVKGLL